MMQLKVSNGIVNTDQIQFYANLVGPHNAEQDVMDITTQANIQLCGIKMEDSPTIIDNLHARS